MAKVNFITQGSSGKVQYIEGSLLKKNTCEFYWEFGGADTVAIIWIPAEGKWDAKYPWASGRRKEIITFVPVSMGGECVRCFVDRCRSRGVHLVFLTPFVPSKCSGRNIHHSDQSGEDV